MIQDDREKNVFFGRDWIDVHSITRSELEYVLEQAAKVKTAIKERRVADYKFAKDRDMIAALLFYEPSTRTRTSFEIAAKRLGLETTGFAGTEATSVKKGESLIDTVDMYDTYDVDAIIMRHPLDGAAKAVVDHLKKEEKRLVPCFNGGDGKNEHPTQAILDAFTIKECCGRLSNLQVGIAVDALYGRTTHSLPVILGLMPGNVLHIFTHELLRMPKSVLNYLDSIGMEYHEYFQDGQQMRELLPQLDFLYMTRPQEERFTDISDYYKARDMFRFSLDMMEGTKDSFGLGHPLPDKKEHPSILPDVHRHPKYWAKRQAGNGVPTRFVEMALSLGFIGSDFSGEIFRPKDISDLFYEERNPNEVHKKKNLDIRPIDNGTVIDHIENDPYMIDRIAELLQVREKRNIYRSGVVVPRMRPDVSKGVLMIQDRYLTDDEVRMIATMAPGSTVNDIQGKDVVRKRNLYLPDVIEGLPGMQCNNHGCITRPEHNEHVQPRAVRVGAEGSTKVKCYYCNNLMDSHTMF